MGSAVKLSIISEDTSNVSKKRQSDVLVYLMETNSMFTTISRHYIILRPLVLTRKLVTPLCFRVNKHSRTLTQIQISE